MALEKRGREGLNTENAEEEHRGYGEKNRAEKRVGGVRA